MKFSLQTNSWHFHIYKQRNVHDHQCLARKNLQLLVISCSAELSRKKVLLPRAQADQGIFCSQAEYGLFAHVIIGINHFWIDCLQSSYSIYVQKPKFP